MTQPAVNSDAVAHHASPAYVIEDRLFVNNEFVSSKSGLRLDVYNPTTEKVCASVYEATEEDVDIAVNAAKAAFPAWSNLNAQDRGHYLEKWADALERALPEMAYLDAISMGKPAYPDRELTFLSGRTMARDTNSRSQDWHP